ncbi:hypothetical protein A374_06256 [Fictibacillus macauensis ZFHKF-1]|uniref:PqqD family protein n=1 Tax=Fictibacillus macauensis ZFHKF-1 TaxID=1196324 RepID=I8AKS6_9BACL|nr:hypothetical protein [Fictibacillus macauensis]EIT86179.1 hypothetical protein A374_06256 [Fictibacillus macauensis ZFHKF-1]
MVNESSFLTMHNLQRRKENSEEYLIGRTDESNFVILPNIAIEIIDLYDQQLTTSDISKIMQERGIEVDVLDFAENLVNDLQFVYKVDGVIINDVVEDKSHFKNLSPTVSRLLFSNFAYFIYILFLLVGMCICISNTTFIPTYQDIFVFDSISSSIIFATLLGWILIFKHEFAHLMAAKSLGINSRIGLGHRLVFPVVETDMSNIVLLPHNKRYRALLAGMAWDGALFGIGVVFLLLNTIGIEMNIVLLNIIKLINLHCVLAIAFQFMFYLETDMYYVFTTYFKCNNLLHNTRLYIRKLTKRISKEQTIELQNIDQYEKKIMQKYVWFYLLGVIWAIGIFIIVSIPALLKFLSIAIMKALHSNILSIAFWDALIFIAISSIPTGILIYSWIKTWKSNRVSNRPISLD